MSHRSHIRTAPGAALLKGNLLRERWGRNECVGGGETGAGGGCGGGEGERQGEGGRWWVFLSETSLNTRYRSDNRLTGGRAGGEVEPEGSGDASSSCVGETLNVQRVGGCV